MQRSFATRLMFRNPDNLRQIRDKLQKWIYDSIRPFVPFGRIYQMRNIIILRTQTYCRHYTDI